MKKTLFSFVLTAALILSLAGCGKAPAGEPQAASSGPAAGPGRQDGERFEAAIVIEGMEETVLYEHIRNETVGFEMDYDCEQFTRQSRSDRERFVSVWDDPDEPTNYIEVTYSPQDANAAAASVGETLSADYEIVTEPWELDRAGSCIRIDASEVKGGGYMPDLLQTVYIIPARDGSRIAAAHCTAESAEGFGRRVAYMMDTLAVVDRQDHSPENPQPLTGTWQTASVGYETDGAAAPEYHVRFTDSAVIYGHVKEGTFVFDHSDRIIRIEETAAGGLRVQAETADGKQYTYQTCESDMDILEYYETWRKEDFPDMYRGGASLSRSDAAADAAPMNGAPGATG